MAEVANGLSKDRCLPAALRPWRTMERSAWTETLIHITTTLQRGAKQPVSEQAVSHGAAFSCSGFPTGTPWSSLWEMCRAEHFVGKLHKEMENQKNMVYFWLCRNADMRLEKRNMMNGWRESTAMSARAGRSDAMWKMIKIIWGGDKSHAIQNPLWFVTWHHDYCKDFLR